MAEIKDNITGEKARNLKRADSKKIHGDTAQSNIHRNENLGSNMIIDHSFEKKLRVKKNLPIAVDIIAGILMLVLVCSIVVGSYMLFRYYSNDYDGVDVIYTVAFDTTEETAKQLKSMKNEDVFVDINSNAIYFGKITGVETVEENSAQNRKKITLTIKANAKYRKGEGYSLGDERLAVGKSFKLRCNNVITDVVVIELDTEDK